MRTLKTYEKKELYEIVSDFLTIKPVIDTTMQA